MMTTDAFIQRLEECILEGPVTQTAIAQYCGVTKQSVGAWKRNGLISKENLFKLSEITNFRYLWLKDGSGSKRIIDPEANLNDFLKTEKQRAYLPGSGSLTTSDAGQELIEAIAQASATHQFSDEALGHLAAFFKEIAKR